VDPIGEEQRYLDLCHAQLGRQTAHLEARIVDLARSPGTGTEQDLLEKQALYDNLARQVIAARAAVNRLCFGRIDLDDARTLRVGRIGLRDEDGEPVLLDWRAPNAAGFYQATSVDRMGVARRRRIITRDATVTHVEDEDLDNPTAVASDAAAAAVAAPRDGRMADIVATIAVDQDRIIRSPLNQVTVVEGGPGTGKTVVALHRAAWLLYTHRDRLARDGVLIVGPSTAFLRYIDQVLPSLGETDVVLLTPGQLYPSVSTSVVDPPAAARIKGDLVMIKVISRAVRQRIRVPEHDVTIRLEDGGTATLTAADLVDARRAVPRSATFHGGREPFLRRALDLLARSRLLAQGHDPDDADARQAAVVDLAMDASVRRTLNLMWLPITPERLVTRLLTDPDVLAQAADGLLTADQQRAILRSVDDPWTVDDVPLLDEAAELLGELEARRRTSSQDGEYGELVVEDPHARRFHQVGIADRALADRTWVYGHVIVDEAQELSRMAWHALQRRCSRRSMTVVGDLQQTSHPAGARSWREALGWAGHSLDLHTLRVTYRITRQTATTATEWLTRAGGTAPHLEPIRDGLPSEVIACLPEDLPALILDSAREQSGRIAVVVPDDRVDELGGLMVKAGSAFALGDDGLDADIAILTSRQTKGLEFDQVFVVDPEAISRQAEAGAEIYVACTRATQRLHLVFA
jgi:DNA helicase IV